MSNVWLENHALFCCYLAVIINLKDTFSTQLQVYNIT